MPPRRRFVLARSPTADVRDLLWGAAGENPKNPQHASHAAHLPHGGPLAGRTRGAQREAELRGGAALSTREAVARCASRLIFRLAPGTPTTYAGAREQSSQVGPGRGGRPLARANTSARVRSLQEPPRRGLAPSCHQHAVPAACRDAFTGSLTSQPTPPSTLPCAARQARVVTEPHPPFKVVHVNRAWEQLCGWREAEVQGATMAILQVRRQGGGEGGDNVF